MITLTSIETTYWVVSSQNPGDHPTSFSYGHARFYVASFSLSHIFCDILTYGHFYDMVTLCYTKLHERLSFLKQVYNTSPFSNSISGVQTNVDEMI